MLLGVCVLCRISIAKSVVNYCLNVRFSRLITSVWEERAGFFCYLLLVIVLFLFEEVSSSFVCLGKAALFLWHSLGLSYNYFESVCINKYAMTKTQTPSSKQKREITKITKITNSQQNNKIQ